MLSGIYFKIQSIFIPELAHTILVMELLQPRMTRHHVHLFVYKKYVAPFGIVICIGLDRITHNTLPEQCGPT